MFWLKIIDDQHQELEFIRANTACRSGERPMANVSRLRETVPITVIELRTGGHSSKPVDPVWVMELPFGPVVVPV